jgi:hypothetical protein
MKLTSHACTEALSGAEEAGRGERAEDSAGGVRVEREVRPAEDITCHQPFPSKLKRWAYQYDYPTHMIHL